MARISSDQLRELEAAGKVARGSTIEPPADAAPKRREKYGRERIHVDGISFDSKLEARRYGELMTLYRSGEILAFDRQVTIRLGVDENRYRVDFLVWTSYGQCHAEDVKGFETASSKRHLRFWRRYGPCDLHILKRGKGEWQMQIVEGRK